jgi:ligand-binding SRPBCC domain-containing protein
MMALKNLSRGSRAQQLMKHPMPTNLGGVMNKNILAKRNYFSFVDKMKDRFNKPWRHVQSFMEPDGINYQT